MDKKSNKSNIKRIAINKKARHDYFIEEVIEAGIQLFGTEIKSIRQGRVNLRESYANIDQEEAFLNQMHISQYEKGNIFNSDPVRRRKLLMHKKEIAKLGGFIAQKGYSLVPLSLYFKNSKLKVELGVAKGKKLYDKRRDLIEKTVKRDIERKLKENYR